MNVPSSTTIISPQFIIKPTKRTEPCQAETRNGKCHQLARIGETLCDGCHRTNQNRIRKNLFNSENKQITYSESTSVQEERNTIETNAHYAFLNWLKSNFPQSFGDESL